MFMKDSMLAATLALGLASAMPICLAADATTPPVAKVEAGDVKVKLADCPAAVQDTLKKEAGAGTIGNVEKDAEDGKTSYEADVTIDGKAWEIKVAEDGKLVSKAIDDDKDEKEGKVGKVDKDDKEEKDDKDDKDEQGEHEDKD
jgi:hypothetical protein